MPPIPPIAITLLVSFLGSIASGLGGWAIHRILKQHTALALRVDELERRTNAGA